MHTVPTSRTILTHPDRGTQERVFARRRIQAIDRLARRGMARCDAQAWIDAWLASTMGLEDFRAAGDYWDMAVRYALEERRRGYPPPATASGE